MTPIDILAALAALLSVAFLSAVVITIVEQQRRFSGLVADMLLEDRLRKDGPGAVVPVLVLAVALAWLARGATP